VDIDKCRKISDKGVQCLTTKLGRNFKHLENLSLNFDGYRNSSYEYSLISDKD